MNWQLRNTRRGWLRILAADQGANATTGAAPAAAAPAGSSSAAASSSSAPLNYKAKLLALLGLDDTADDATIDAKITEYSTAMSGMGDLQTKASTAAQLQTQLDEINQKYADLNNQQQALYKQKQEADADEILTVYAGCFTDETSKAAIRNILLSDKDAGIAILNGLKKPEAAAAGEETTTTTTDTGKTPPAPQHDPSAAAAPTEEEKVAQQNALIKEIRAEGKFKDYESARGEARRRKPELFS